MVMYIENKEEEGINTCNRPKTKHKFVAQDRIKSTIIEQQIDPNKHLLLIAEKFQYQPQKSREVNSSRVSGSLKDR